MGKKYIIELEDKPFHKDGDFLCRVKGFNSLVFDMTGIGMLTPYTEPDLKKVRKEAYKEGREDGIKDGMCEAWEASKKIINMPFEERRKIFVECLIQKIHSIYTASEAIEKIRQYEQRQEEIQVGDEVATDAGNRASVLYENPDGTQAFVFKSDGTAAWWTKSALHRTGRNFPEVATILEKMRGEQDG